MQRKCDARLYLSLSFNLFFFHFTLLFLFLPTGFSYQIVISLIDLPVGRQVAGFHSEKWAWNILRGATLIIALNKFKEVWKC